MAEKMVAFMKIIHCLALALVAFSLTNCVKEEGAQETVVVAKPAPAKTKYTPSLGKASEIIALWKNKLEEMEKKKKTAD